MTKLLTIVALFLYTHTSWAQMQPLLTVKSIPDSLKNGVPAVYILDEMSITVESHSKMTQRTHNIIAIMDKEGLHHSLIQIGVDRFVKLDEVLVKVFNESGIEVARYKKKDFELNGTSSEMTLASDEKFYSLDASLPNFPFIVEYEYTVNFSGYISLPSWYLGSTEHSYLKSKLLLSTKKANPIKYKSYNTSIKPRVIDNGDIETYEWEMSNQPVLKIEAHSYGRRLLPRIDIAPLYFNYDGYPGTTKSWAEFGMWRYPFYNDEKPFSLQRIEFIKSLVQSAKNDYEKVRLLYKYLQKETRYVNISYGIGGLKPFPVSFVEEKKYGDCKALSNYMKHLLSVVGIKAYTASIYAGPDNIPFDIDFVTNRSNHIIVCVPMNKDTIWLECTSKSNEPGVLGSFTENRNALLITENGGVLVNTPKSKVIHNQWHAKSYIKLYDDGSALISSNVYVTGEFNEKVNYLLTNKSKADLKKVLINAFGIKSPDDFELQPLLDSADGTIVKLKLAYGRYFDVQAGKKMFFPVRHYRFYENELQDTSSRTTDYQFSFPFIKTDSLVYEIPSVLKPDQLPVNQQLKNDFFNYANESLMNSSGNELRVHTALQVHRLQIPAVQYRQAALSMMQVRKDASQKMILRKE